MPPWHWEHRLSAGNFKRQKQRGDRARPSRSGAGERVMTLPAGSTLAQSFCADALELRSARTGAEQRNENAGSESFPGAGIFSRCAAKTELCATLISLKLWFLSIPESWRRIRQSRTFSGLRS